MCVLWFFVHFFAAVYKSSQNNNVKKRHSAYLRERELYDGQFLCRILKLSCTIVSHYWCRNPLLRWWCWCLHILFGIFLRVETNWMNSNSREIRRLSIKSAFFKRRCLWRCCSERLHFRPSVCLPSLCLRVCLLCTHLSKRFSAVHSVVLVWAVYIRL